MDNVDDMILFRCVAAKSRATYACCTGIDNVIFKHKGVVYPHERLASDATAEETWLSRTLLT